MKTQAWGWLMAAVLAAGLNASYHDGGLQWAHEIASRLEHRSAAVLALATGNADRFVSEAQVLRARQQASPCRLTAALAQVQNRVARTESRFDWMSARQEAQLADLDANRARIEAQVETQIAHLRVPQADFNPVVLALPELPACPRTRVNLPRLPMIRIPAPAIHIHDGGSV
jgi:hypothetical protein